MLRFARHRIVRPVAVVLVTGLVAGCVFRRIDVVPVVPTRASGSGANLAKVIWTGDKLIAAGDSGVILTSPDGQPVIAMVPCYVGALEAGERALAPLRAFGSPVVDTVAPCSYTDQQAIIAQIRNFLAQARQAQTDNDPVRAHNLALKAHLLSDELVRR